MRQVSDKIGFYAGVVICNAMVWGMFTMLNVPHINVSALSNYSTAPLVKRSVSVATVGNPIRVVVAGVGIDVNVQKGTFDPSSQEWSLSDHTAYYAEYSVPANDSNGTTLIYGHARPTMFEPLKHATPGMQAEVYSDTNKVFIYEYSSVREVVPTDTSVFTDVGPSVLVLQTCTGPWDSYRALHTFNFKEVRSL